MSKLNQRTGKMKIILLISLIAISQIVYGQKTVERFDSLLNNYYACEQFNGNVLIADKGEIVYQKSFGYADFAKKTPNYCLYSIVLYKPPIWGA